MIVSGFVKHEMHMARSVAVAFQTLQQFANRSIVGDGVRHWHDCLEPKQSVFVTVHHRSLVWTFTSRILNIVVSFAVRLPDVNLDAFDGFATSIFDCAENKARFAVRIMRDLGTIWFYLGFMRMEWAENRPFRACRRLWMIDAID
jgi:hypothetical protein